MLVCRQFGEAGSRLPGLWATVALSPQSVQSMASMVAWVAARQGHVRRLSLLPAGDFQHQELLPLWGMMASTFVVASASLLRWAGGRDLRG